MTQFLRLALSLALLISATAFSYKVTLAWDYPAEKIGEITGFKIYRSANGGPFTPVSTVASNKLTYAEAGLNEGISYTYQATAIGKSGVESIPSNQTLYVALPKLKEMLNANKQFMGVTFTTKPGNVYAVETSSDLKRWRQITTVTATADTYDYVAPANAPMGFFRVKLLSGPSLGATPPSVKINYLVLFQSPKGALQRMGQGPAMISPGDKPYIIEEAKLQTGEHGI
jgi:hypothetical protein